MLYLSLAVIFLGILIFAYSILVDAKKRRDELRPHGSEHDDPSGSAAYSGGGAGAGAHRSSGDAPAHQENKRNHPVAEDSGREQGPLGRPASASRSEKQAVLYEDSSHVIDYANQSGSIDPSLEGYKSIKRIGRGHLDVERGGVTFYMGKKLYRFDFHRVRDVKSGTGHLAIFLEGSDAVRLFIIESGSAISKSVVDAYREYQRSSA